MVTFTFLQTNQFTITTFKTFEFNSLTSYESSGNDSDSITIKKSGVYHFIMKM